MSSPDCRKYVLTGGLYLGPYRAARFSIVGRPVFPQNCNGPSPKLYGPSGWGVFLFGTQTIDIGAGGPFCTFPDPKNVGFTKVGLWWIDFRNDRLKMNPER